jgi:hypothetical protein
MALPSRQHTRQIQGLTKTVVRRWHNLLALPLRFAWLQSMIESLAGWTPTQRSDEPRLSLD